MRRNSNSLVNPEISLSFLGSRKEKKGRWFSRILNASWKALCTILGTTEVHGTRCVAIKSKELGQILSTRNFSSTTYPPLPLCEREQWKLGRRNKNARLAQFARPAPPFLVPKHSLKRCAFLFRASTKKLDRKKNRSISERTALFCRAKLFVFPVLIADRSSISKEGPLWNVDPSSYV